MDAALNNEAPRSNINPLKFGLWAACGSITMMFVAFTSAYLVRQSAGNWLEFRLPDMFYFSTAVIVLSSISLHASYLAFKKGNEARYKLLLTLALLLGTGFLILQYQGWLAMQNIGVAFNGNPSGSFIYVISGVHAAHILGGLAAILVAVLNAFSLVYKVTPARKLRFELTLTYWHFVDLLWVYLFLFFISQQG